jgi:2-dehydropantoate 2-reductase
MRFVVYGAGAVGGVVGAMLARHGHDVAMIARGDHGRAIRDKGLRVDSPDGSTTIQPTRLAEAPAGLEWRSDDCVLLAVKSQDTLEAVSRLVQCAPASVSVACLQNGVANEPTVLRWFAHVYGVTVMCPAAHLEPGVVVAYSSPTPALLDIGRYPDGEDDAATAISAAFNRSTMDSVVRPDIMRWKYAKLILMNLANAIDALCGPDARGGQLAKVVQEEGERVLHTAGIDFASAEEDRRRRGKLLRIGNVPGQPRGGSSSWQSLARSSGSIETDYLNGEIVLLGRLHSVPTPANETLQRLASQAAMEKWPPARMTEKEILELIEGA